MAAEAALRNQIVHVGRLLYEKGLISAADGNISGRLAADRFLVTPSGLAKGSLEADQLLLVDGHGRRLGPRSGANRSLKPTSELPMHLEAYRLRPEVGAVVHAHPPITIALSIAGIPLADCLLPETIVFLGLIPTAPYTTPSSEESVKAVRQFIARHDALVLQRHGSLTVGDDPLQAFMRLETMEQNARIAYMLAQLGVRSPLPPDEVAKLLAQREAMGLCRPGEAELFCRVCGVCHVGPDHAPTLRALGGERPAAAVRNGTRSQTIDPMGLPPIGRRTLGDEEIRQMVADIVQKTLGQR